MFLHEDKVKFNAVILDVSKNLNIAFPIVLKDYYVFMLLKQIAKNNPDAMFKGGTSLSKAYGLINRFSEDIDLNAIPSNPLSEGARVKFNHGVKDSFNTIGLTIKSNIRSKSDFNAFIANIPNMQRTTYLNDDIKVESVLRRKGRVLTCKYNTCWISNYIYDYYLRTTGNTQELEFYELTPFQMHVQDIYYTLCEKLIAVGNYYLRGKSERLSRHLYDITKLLGVGLDLSYLRSVFVEVVSYTRERGFDEAILNGNNLEDCIRNALLIDFYKDDFINVTSKFIFEQISYDVCKKAVLELVNTGICETLSF